jgi:hypothetical protein
VSLFVPVFLCLMAYLRWQLGDAWAENVCGEGAAASSLPGAVPSLAAANDCSFSPSLAEAAMARACAAGLAPCERQPELEPSWSHALGVYTDANGGALAPNADATSRGRWLAERIINGGLDGNEPPRRGKKGALDVIVVGANLLGISATLHLMQAGLRVLLVDRQSWAPLDAASHRLIAARPAAGSRMRLPLVTGHHVTLVAERADGMLELQAERAAWYTANVIFASSEGAPASRYANELRTPVVACAPAASRAA